MERLNNMDDKKFDPIYFYITDEITDRFFTKFNSEFNSFSAESAAYCDFVFNHKKSIKNYCDRILIFLSQCSTSRSELITA